MDYLEQFVMLRMASIDDEHYYIDITDNGNSSHANERTKAEAAAHTQVVQHG
jgi:ABC-type uncharacterized transport system substrate-binding protein